MNKYIWRVVLSASIVAVIIIIAVFGFRGSLTAEALTSGGGFLYRLVQQNYFVSIVIYILIIALFTAIFTPGIIFLTIGAGILFGTVPGAIASNIGMTVGSISAFLSSRYILHDLLRNRFKSRLANFDEHIKKQGWHYLLFLRLSPVIPAFLINLLSGLTKIGLWTFIWTTSIGSLPADFIYAYLGNRIKNFQSVTEIYYSEVLIALILLATISFFPIWLRRKPLR